MTGRRCLVVDTSSLILLRELPKADGRAALRHFDDLLNAGDLGFPDAVAQELAKQGGTELHEWADEHKRLASRGIQTWQLLPRVLRDVPLIVDATKAEGEDADPHVLAMALHLKDENIVPTVLTEDRRDQISDTKRLKKLSLASACGVLDIYSPGLVAYLHSKGARRRQATCRPHHPLQPSTRRDRRATLPAHALMRRQPMTTCSTSPEQQVVSAFRRLRGAPKHPSTELTVELRRAASRREIVIDLANELANHHRHSTSDQAEQRQQLRRTRRPHVHAGARTRASRPRQSILKWASKGDPVDLRTGLLGRQSPRRTALRFLARYRPRLPPGGEP